ncbi:tetratricopeptide repeat protein, partial [Cardiobacterium sp. AH-315-I02]|nr:tetratricopeptide repeat protein [Cardiobacterium sp. AH-315-I02]
MKLSLSLVVFTLILLSSCQQDDSNSSPIINTRLVEKISFNISPADFVGAKQCINCHQNQYNDWSGSHHDLAMQHASEETVLGDFNHSTFHYFGTTSTFYKKDNHFFVQTDGADGKLREFQIKYTFGVEPLQQYLIEFADGRVQALGIAWDSRSKEKGGQRWYHLYPDEKINFQHRLHWTKPDQNWNYMCADCHSTNLQKNYNAETDTFKTTWSEINVACEACHGPASNHINWANKKPGWLQLDKKGLLLEFDQRDGVSWIIDSNTGNAQRSKALASHKEIEICARCHSRRSIISENFAFDKFFMDFYIPSLLTDFLYHPDGQIKEEVFVHGSFIQSKMYHQGVSCSDCHEPHSLKLRAQGNGVCLQCHAANKFNTSAHHFHQANSTGSSCIECHMPQTLYMGVDWRADHSIRIPRPDLSVKLATPNACNNCHEDKTALWASQAMTKWVGKDWSPGWHFGETLHDAQNQMPNVAQDLAAVAVSPKLPAIARATAADLLQTHPSPTSSLVINRLLKDENPMIRLAALQTLDSFDLRRRLQSGFALLTDPVRAVRIEAARILAVIPYEMLSAQQTATLKKAIAEYREAQNVNADRPEAHINLGLLAIRLQQFDVAEKSYRQAVQLDVNFVEAYINLADLYRMQHQENKAEKILQQAIQLSANTVNAHHALGLLYVRNKQSDKALLELKTAYQMEADNSRFSYVYAVALASQQKTEQAIIVLEKMLKQNPNNRDALIAIISFSLQRSDSE